MPDNRINSNIQQILILSGQITPKLEAFKSRVNEAELYLKECSAKKDETINLMNKSDQLFSEVKSLTSSHKKKMKKYSSLRTV